MYTVCCKIRKQKKKKKKVKDRRERERGKIKKKKELSHSNVTYLYCVIVASVLSRYGCPLHGNCAHGIRGYITRHCLLFITLLKYGLVTGNPSNDRWRHGISLTTVRSRPLFDKSSFVRLLVVSKSYSEIFFNLSINFLNRSTNLIETVVTNGKFSVNQINMYEEKIIFYLSRVLKDT